jgi:hypothetical protein
MFVTQDDPSLTQRFSVFTVYLLKGRTRAPALLPKAVIDFCFDRLTLDLQQWLTS